MTIRINTRLRLQASHVRTFRELRTGLSLRAWTELLLNELCCPGRGDTQSWIPAWRVANSRGVMDPRAADFTAAMHPEMPPREILSLVWFWGAAKDGLIPAPQAAELANVAHWYDVWIAAYQPRRRVVSWQGVYGPALIPAVPERGSLTTPHALYKPRKYDVRYLPWMAGREQGGE